MTDLEIYYPNKQPYIKYNYHHFYGNIIKKKDLVKLIEDSPDAEEFIIDVNEKNINSYINAVRELTPRELLLHEIENKKEELKELQSKLLI